MDKTSLTYTKHNGAKTECKMSPYTLRGFEGKQEQLHRGKGIGLYRKSNKERRTDRKVNEIL